MVSPRARVFADVRGIVPIVAITTILDCAHIVDTELFLKISTAEILLQPHIAATEEVPAAHLLQLQLGDSASAIPPGNRHGGPGISPHDGFERQLDGEVEVRRDQRLATLDHTAP